MITGLTTAELSLETLLSKCNELAGALNAIQKLLPEKDRIIEEQKQKIQEQDLQILKLSHELNQLKKLVFGSKSERFQPQPANQLSLGLNEQPAPAANPLPPLQISYHRQKAAPASKHAGRMSLPAHLPRKQVLIEPEGLDTSLCKKIGEEITEELDYVPCRFFVRQYVRPKYVCPAAEGVVIAPLPDRPIPKAIAGPALLSYIICVKFLLHLPVYRQAQQFKREGVSLAASTINDWIKASCQLLDPLYQLLQKQVVSSSYLQADESPIKVLDKDKKGGTHKGWHWVYHAPEKKLVLFDYQKGRGSEGPEQMLKDFRGYLQTDGYNGYEPFAKTKGVVVLNCWAHARRYFVDAQKNDPKGAEYVLKELQRIYAMERQAKKGGLEEKYFLKLRKKREAAILKRLKAWLLEYYQHVTPQSLMGKAIAYTLCRWEKLLVYQQDVRLQIDNNLVENAIRPLALGRKNYMFSGSHEGARRAAMIYSFMGSCKMHQINSQAWLTDVLERIASHPVNKLEELLPGNWIPNPKAYNTQISDSDFAHTVA
jgi:transposase